MTILNLGMTIVVSSVDPPTSLAGVICFPEGHILHDGTKRTLIASVGLVILNTVKIIMIITGGSRIDLVLKSLTSSESDISHQQNLQM